MGINDRADPLSKVIQLSDITQGTGNTIENGNYTSDECSSVASEAPVAPSRRNYRSNAHEVDYQSIANRLQLKGHRRARRQNHLTFVRTLVGLEEADVEDELSWVPEYGQSAFSLLLSESSKMRTWNRFVEMSEGEQLSVIRADNPSEKSDGLVTEEGEERNQAKEDSMRSVHPSYSSEQCFDRIEKHLKSILTRRHRPLGILENLENSLRNVFTSSPSAYHYPDVTSAYERLLVHALTQYLDLQSFSQGGNSARRLTVVNKKKMFSPPDHMLAEFLEWKSGKGQLI